MRWLRRKLGLWFLGVDPKKPQTIVIRPVYLDRIFVHCSECKKGGIWAAPEGFKVAIPGNLLVACENGHIWQISGAWAEEKEQSHDN